jgi:hypothetical protein
MFNALEKHLALAAGCAAWLCLVTFLVVKEFGGHLPAAPVLPAMSSQAAKIRRTRQIDDLFSLSFLAQRKVATNLNNPFFAGQFQTPPVPPAPTTRKITVVYQGYFATTHGEKQAFVKVGDQLIVGPVGTKIAADLTINLIDLGTLTLKDGAGKPTPLPFNAPQTLEIPL